MVIQEACNRICATVLNFSQLRLAVKVAAFAFPFGLADPDLLEVARRAGVVGALTTEEELVSPQSEPFGWGRFIVAECDTPSTLAACLGGWYSVLRWYSPGAARYTPARAGFALSCVGDGAQGVLGLRDALI